MARLNETEKLIQRAALRLTVIEAQAFDKLIEFFDDHNYLYGGNDLEIIYTLYCTKHTSPFEVLAGALGTSVSRLEKKRKNFQKIFLRHYEQLISKNPDVA